MIVKLYIDNQRLDLFKDESIEINSSIANVNDISKNTTDYAKSFTVPASTNNNLIFRHYYDANVDNTFDARIRVDGHIELDGLPFRTGTWQLEKVILKKGDPYSYSINFVGNLFTLKDKLGNDELSSLDLSEFDHNYTSNIVKGFLQNSGDLIYNLLVKKQLYYTSGGGAVNTELLANIATSGVNFDQLKPSIRLIKIIEAIEVKYGINFSRDFFGRSEFNQLYMWLNNDSELYTIRNNNILIDFTNYGTMLPETLDLAKNAFIKRYKFAYSFNNWGLNIEITPSAGYENVVYGIQRIRNGQDVNGFFNLQGYRRVAFLFEQDGDEQQFKIITNKEFKFSSKISVQYENYGYQEASFPEQTLMPDLIVSNHIPKLKIIDFLKGLFQMFKLVVVSDDNTNIYINTIKDYYSQGKVWNISRYVKTDTLEVSRAQLLNEIKLKFKEPTTILNKQFKKLTEFAYGDVEVQLTDDGTPTGKPLEGTSFSIELPFEQIIYERLNDLADGVQTNIMYGAIVDDKLGRVNPAPHIFYNINTVIGTKTLGFINDLGVRETLTGNLNIPSHSIDFETPQYNLSYDIELNEWNNISSEKTLYSNYYNDYLTSIFNIKRRDFSFNAILPLPILLQLKLNDILEIKNNYYRINNFNLNLVTGEIKLNLLNAFDNIINGFTANVTELFADYTAQMQSVSIPNIGNSSVEVSADSWLSATIVGTNIFFEFLENTTGLNRINTALVTNLETFQTIEISIIQYAKSVTTDTISITTDTNLIKTDNG